jgi:Undecaprenyl-phosphate glucose phosphotransferase
MVLHVLSDIVIIVISYLAATFIRFSLMDGGSQSSGHMWTSAYILMAFVLAVVIIFIYFLIGMYTSIRVRKLPVDAAKMVIVNTVCIAFLAGFFYLIRMTDFSRVSLFLFLVISTVLIVAKRGVMLYLLHRLREHGFNIRSVLIVGCGSLAAMYVRSIEDNKHLGFRIVGFVGDGELADVNRLGDISGLGRILEERAIDEVIIALDAADTMQIPDVIGICARQGIRTSILPFYCEFLSAKIEADVIGDCKLIPVRNIPLDSFWNSMIKRCFDVAGSLLLIILTSPVMLVAAIGVKRSSPGPVLFHQVRIGYNKKSFEMYKFRSMRIEADQTIEIDGSKKTKWGSLLRKTSIDELPQFFNVLKGEMSLIGPRPLPAYEAEFFQEKVDSYHFRHSVRPGCTGWAQVNGIKGEDSIKHIDERMRYDFWYIENWSLALDFKILFKTIGGGMVNNEKIKT